MWVQDNSNLDLYVLQTIGHSTHYGYASWCWVQETWHQCRKANGLQLELIFLLGCQIFFHVCRHTYAVLLHTGCTSNSSWGKSKPAYSSTWWMHTIFLFDCLSVLGGLLKQKFQRKSKCGVTNQKLLAPPVPPILTAVSQLSWNQELSYKCYKKHNKWYH